MNVPELARGRGAGNQICQKPAPRGRGLPLCRTMESGEKGQQGGIERGILIGNLAGGGIMRVDVGMSWHGQRGAVNPKRPPQWGFRPQQESRPDGGDC